MGNSIKQEHPIVFYKYKDVTGNGIDHFEDMLRNNRLWFSSPLAFNDPFDCRCVFDIENTRDEIVLRKAAFLAKRKGVPLSDVMVEAEHEIPHEPSELKTWQIQQVEGHSRRAANTGILCLTPICDNLLMWTHYAKEHRGVCIMFRVRNVNEESQLDFIAKAQRVEYVDHCPLINFVRDETSDILKKAFFTKSAPYRYEAEWRMVQYDGAPGLKPIPKGIIGGVILGVQVDTTTRDRVIKACSEYDGDVDIVRAVLDPNTYGLRLELEQTV